MSYISIVIELCKKGDWSTWSSCSETCGPQNSTRVKKMIPSTKNEMNECIGDEVETKECFDVRDCSGSISLNSLQHNTCVILLSIRFRFLCIIMFFRW